MILEMLPLFATLGFLGGVLSGWLGIGGGIVMAPLLLYVPPLVSGAALDMKGVAGLTMAQGFFAALSGVIAHRRHGAVCKRLVAYMGVSTLVGSAAGSVSSQFVQPGLLEGIFAALALVAAGSMFLPKEEGRIQDAEAVAFHKGLALVVPLILGFLLGMVGQAGAFILIPVMLYLLKIPTRIAIGSSLGVVFLSASAGLFGKLITGQVPLLPAVALVLGALAGAQVGGYFSVRTRTETLRHVLAFVIAFVALGIWYDLLGRAYGGAWGSE